MLDPEAGGCAVDFFAPNVCASGRKKSLAGGGGLAKGNMRSMKDDLLRSIQQGFLKFAAERIHRARLAAAAALTLRTRNPGGISLSRLLATSQRTLQQSAAGYKPQISQLGYQEATSFMWTSHWRVDEAMRRQDRFLGELYGPLFIGREYSPQARGCSAHNSRRRLREHPGSVSHDPVARARGVSGVAQ